MYVSKQLQMKKNLKTDKLKCKYKMNRFCENENKHNEKPLKREWNNYEHNNDKQQKSTIMGVFFYSKGRRMYNWMNV